MITIRPAVAGDQPVILDIVGRVFREYGFTLEPHGWDKDLADPITHYAPPGATLVVAERAGHVIGLAGAHIEGSVAELHRVYINPDARGLGLGRRLCLEMETWAREKAATEVHLWSDVRLAHAHAMYRAMGYQIFGSRELADPDKSIEFGMKRLLPAAGADAAPNTRAPRALTDELARDVENILLSRVSPALAHAARMTASAILDQRRIQPPEVASLFASANDIEVILAAKATILGFRELPSRQTLWHPSVVD